MRNATITLVSLLAFLVLYAGAGTAASGQFTNLGVQVSRVVTTVGTVFADADGNYYHGILIDGEPAKFVVVDVKTRKSVHTYDVPGTKGNWSILVGDDHNVYIGGSGSGTLYRYVPGDDKVESLGQAISGESHIYGMTNGPDGLIYGGTYPGGKVFVFDTKTGQFRDLGVAVPGEKYARQVVYDPAQNALYVGTGAGCKIIRWSLDTGEKTGDILGGRYATGEYPNSLHIMGDLMFAQINGSSTMAIIDLRTNHVLTEKAGATAGIALLPGTNRAYMYVPGEGMLYYFDVTQRKLTPSISIGKFSGWKGAAFIDLQNPFMPGYSLVAWGGNTSAVLYNLRSGLSFSENVAVPPQPIEIRSIYGGPDGKVYSSGILGGLGVYDPDKDTTTSYSLMSQSEGITSIGSTIYFGAYPNARLWSLDTRKPIGSGNPTQFAAIAATDMQDRPFAMLGVAEENKLFIGTLAQYGQLAGAFSIFDLQTRQLHTYRNIVPNQNVLSLAYLNGKVYAGTSVWGAYGAPAPTEKEAMLFVWDVAKAEKVLEAVPIPGRLGITALAVGSDGNIWGYDEGMLFAYDPSKQEVVFTKQITSHRHTGTTWKDATLISATDGSIYGVARGLFFQIKPQTKEISILDSAHSFDIMGLGQDGCIYLRSGAVKSELWKYTPAQ